MLHIDIDEKQFQRQNIVNTTKDTVKGDQEIQNGRQTDKLHQISINNDNLRASVVNTGPELDRKHDDITIKAATNAISAGDICIFDSSCISPLEVGNLDNSTCSAFNYTKNFYSRIIDRTPVDVEPTSIDPLDKAIVTYMINYSFSKSLASNTYWTGLIYNSYNQIISFINSNTREQCSMRSILKSLSPIIGHQVGKINRKKEQLLSFEGAVILALMKTEYGISLYLEFDEFLGNYPEFAADPKISHDEKYKLLDFCNCVRLVQSLIPTKNNKEHILDITSRLTEGFSVKRVTGTGMTIETRNRYHIIHREGNISFEPTINPERRRQSEQNRNTSQNSSESTEIPFKKKRGRPLSSRVDNSDSLQPVVTKKPISATSTLSSTLSSSSLSSSNSSSSNISSSCGGSGGGGGNGNISRSTSSDDVSSIASQSTSTSYLLTLLLNAAVQPGQPILTSGHTSGVTSTSSLHTLSIVKEMDNQLDEQLDS